MGKVQAFAYAWARYDRELSVSGSVHGVRAKVDAEQLKKDLREELTGLLDTAINGAKI
ncbi:hypothetical protein [Microbulbifer sp. DLAB2-AA]|uniref:hypothetical protein n=1 Tax=Microbulbifer sp. DLAB2-AA TaxID=3243394 RepID=UPI00403A4736